jgi:glycosyltransferase involved in cell wall biosynthesis
MLFSVLIANYNNSKYLDQCVQSVYNQTYTDWEIIVVDDASTDEFEQVIIKYKDDNRIKVYRNEKNQGCSYTKNKLAEKATGDLLAYLDPDDYIDAASLQIMTNAHLQKPNCSIIYSTQYICDKEMNILRINDLPKTLPPNTPYLFLGDGSIHAFASFKKSCYDKTAGLEPVRKKDRAIDQELYYILEEEGDVFFINKPLYYYRIHSGSISNWGNEAAATNENYNIIEESCLRRIKKLKTEKSTDYKYWIKRYKIRYHKIRILNGFRQRRWLSFFSSAAIFPFIGGMDNIKDYFKKIPKEGFSLLKKSFVSSYKINEQH